MNLKGSRKDRMLAQTRSFLKHSHQLLHSARRRARKMVTGAFVQYEPRVMDVPKVMDRMQHPALEAMSFQTPSQLPPKLIQPALPEVDLARLIAYEPDLADLDLVYIRKSLVGVGHRMLAFYRSVHCDPPKAGVPKMMEISVNDGGLSLCPTHVFAVYSPPPPDAAPSPSERIAHTMSERRPTKLFPIHAIVFLAYCANLPPIPRPQPSVVLVRPPSTTLNASSSLRIPVIRCPLPEPSAFLTIANFLYSMSLKPVKIACTPVQEPEPLAVGSREERVAAQIQRLAEGSDLVTIGKHARHVYGVYQNMIALALSDQRIWDYIHFAWETLVGAMRVLESQGHTMPDLATLPDATA